MAVVFDCSSSMAMFRKPYTTTSSVSFAFPPPSAVAGLLSAIIGLGNGASEDGARADYWSELGGTQIALSILNPTRWLRAAVNFWNVKQPQNTPHIQVKHQFVASPKYRIYVRRGIEARLKECLERGGFVYTPYLGVAYAVAQIDYLGEFQPEPVTEKEFEVNSVLPWLEDDARPELDIMKTGGVFSELVPFYLTEERALGESIKVVYSTKAGHPVDAKESQGANQKKGPRSGHPVYVKERGALNVSRCVVRDMAEIVAWFPEWRS